MHDFNVTLYTGKVFGGGTDANVFVKFIGPSGVSNEIALPATKPDMERGM